MKDGLCKLLGWLNLADFVFRKYLNYIRKRAGPFTSDGEEYDSANKEELKARLDFHERMKILFVAPDKPNFILLTLMIRVM